MNDAAAITTVITANPSVTASQLAQLIVAKMKTISDFNEGGISTSGDPFGQFKDGSLYMVNVSDPEFFALSTANPSTKGASFSPKTSTGKPRVNANFPGSTKAYIIHGVETARTSPSAQLAGELTQAGYSVTLSSGGLADWSQLASAGILVNDGHGATVGGKFYVSTTDVETAALDKQYASFIASKAIIVSGIEVYDSATNKHIEQRYLLSIDYLKKLPNFSTMFASNSSFMNVVCSGDAPEAAGFWRSLQSGAGLGDYSGWSRPVDEIAANQSALFFFDRMLGLNQAAPVDPSLPPPGTYAATAALLATTSRGGGSTSNMNQDGPQNVLSFHVGGSLAYIVPSIASLAVSSDGSKVVLTGTFGSDTGAVAYGGAPVTPLSWTDSQIEIPAQPTSAAFVVKTPTGLISNSFSSLGKPSLSPAASTIHQGTQQALKVTVADGVKGATYAYKWTNTAKYGSIADTLGHKGASFTTSVNTVTYSPTPNLYGTDSLTEQTLIVQADGTMSPIGNASATVEVDPSGTLSIDPPSASIDQTQKQPIVVSVQNGATGATYSYQWTNTAQFGAIADESGHSGASFTSALAAVTYTPKGSNGSDNVSVEVFVVAADKTLHSLGSKSCQVSVGVKTLNFSPSDGNVGVSQTQVFTVSPLTGSFPTGASYVWELAGGQGTINGSLAVTTKVPQVTYKAPNHVAGADLDVTVKDSTGKTIATGEQNITVVSVAISPSTVTFAGPGQGYFFGVNGSYPAGTTYKWSCKSGGLSTTGTKTPYPTTLTTTTPRVTYSDPNPPSDGSAASDTLTCKVIGPTGSNLGSGTASIQYGGTPFFIASYPSTQANKIVTGYAPSADMDNLIGNPTNYGLAYGIEDKAGFFQLDMNVSAGTFLAPGQSFTLFEISPNTNLQTFSLSGSVATNSPQLKSGTLTITSEINSPAGNGKYIGFSLNVLCVNGQSIVGNGVVLQHS